MGIDGQEMHIDRRLSQDGYACKAGRKLKGKCLASLNGGL